MRAAVLVAGAAFLTLQFIGCREEPEPVTGTRADSRGTSRGVSEQDQPIAHREASDGVEVYALERLRNSRSRPKGRAKIALLVGVQDYAAGSNVGRLHGPVNDMRLAHYTLVQRFGFDPADIKTLLNDEATHEAIVTWFHRWLIKGADPESQVVFWFSGHGSEVADRAGARGEADGYDSTLLAYDSRAGGRNGEHDILDDELHALVTACPSRFVTVVTDACHSGTVLRGGIGADDRYASRFARRGDRSRTTELAFWPEDVPIFDDADPRRKSLRRNYVHIAAALDHQDARECSPRSPLAAMPDARRFGALTWFLTGAMRRARSGDTYGKIAIEARLMITTESAQTVSIEGNPDRRLFEGRFTSMPDGFETASIGRGRLRIHAGHFMGVFDGTVVDVRNLTDGVVLGRASVYKSGPALSFARWVGKVSVPKGAYAFRSVVATRPSQAFVLRTMIADRSLAKQVAANPWVAVVTDSESPYDYVLRAEGDAGEGRVVFSTRDGHRIFSRDASTEFPTEAFESCARFESRFQSLWRLARPGQSGNLRVSASFVRPTRDELSECQMKMSPAGVRRRARSAGGEFYCEIGRTYEQQEKAEDGTLTTLEVRSSSRVALTVLSLSETRTADGDNQIAVAIMWPREDARGDMFIEGVRRIPIHVAATSGFDGPVRERYVLIATRRAVDFYPLVEDMSHALRGDDSMPPLLRDAFRASRTRSSQSYKPGDWGVVAIDLIVQAKK